MPAERRHRPESRSPLFVAPHETLISNGQPRIQLPPLSAAIVSAGGPSDFNNRDWRATVDLRRPANLGSHRRDIEPQNTNQNVVDLTDSSPAVPQPLPPIIDLSSDADSQMPRGRASRSSWRPPPTREYAELVPVLRRESSSDVVITDERRLPQPWAPAPRTYLPSMARNAQDPLTHLRMMNNNDDDDIIHLGESRRATPLPPPVNPMYRPAVQNTAAYAMLPSMQSVISQIRHTGAVRRIEQRLRAVAGQLGANARQQTGFVPPGHMAYDAVGFTLGEDVVRARESSPYVAPSEPESGCVRSPAEDEVVCCPFCGDELASSDDEFKKQVWVIKACGHVSATTINHEHF